MKKTWSQQVTRWLLIGLYLSTSCLLFSIQILSTQHADSLRLLLCFRLCSVPTTVLHPDQRASCLPYSITKRKTAIQIRGSRENRPVRLPAPRIRAQTVVTPTDVGDGEVAYTQSVSTKPLTQPGQTQLPDILRVPDGHWHHSQRQSGRRTECVPEDGSLHDRSVRLRHTDVRAGRARAISTQQDRSNPAHSQRSCPAVPLQGIHLQPVCYKLFTVSTTPLPTLHFCLASFPLLINV